MRPGRPERWRLYRAVKLCLDEGEAQEGDGSMARWLPSFRRSPPPAAAAAAVAAAADPKSAAPPARSGFRIESWSRTHEGRVRSHNEDSYIARDDEGLWAVADGMGGHEGGEWASGRIVRELGRIETDKGFEARCEARPGRRCWPPTARSWPRARSAASAWARPLVMLIIEGPRYAILWAGDSRAYLMRGGKLVQLSRDHTQVQEMVARGLMTPEQALGHPMGHILSRAVGVQKDIEIDRADGEVQSRRHLPALQRRPPRSRRRRGDIERHFGREAPERALDQLVELTLANGAPDNVTGIASGPATRPSSPLTDRQAMSDEKDKKRPARRNARRRRGAHGVHAGRLPTLPPAEGRRPRSRRPSPSAVGEPPRRSRSPRHRRRRRSRPPKPRQPHRPSRRPLRPARAGLRPP